MRSHCRNYCLDLELSSVGSEFKTWTCRITDRHSKTAIGRGKGWGQQAMASAIAEALEHYWYTFEDTTRRVEAVVHDFSMANVLSRASPDFRLIFGTAQVELDCLLFEGLDVGPERLHFPAVLMDPGYRTLVPTQHRAVERSKLYRYGTNSGTAMGLSEEEAWLHGLLEVIERDAVGIALLRSVIARNPVPVRRVRLASLGGDVGRLPDLLAGETGGCLVELWDVTTDVGVPVLLCALCVDRPTGRYRYFGSGASLVAEYAAERAMLEALQGFHVHQHLGAFFQDPIQPGATTNASLYRKCEMDGGHFDYRGGEIEVDFSDVPTYSLAGVSAQLAFVSKCLNASACPAYRRVIHKSDLITVGQVVVPNLERFYLVAHGIPVAPSWRGRHCLKDLQ